MDGSFGKGKEGWIFLTLLLYPIGYATASYSYWRLGLGPVSLLDKQYFVAGIPGVIAILISKLLSDVADLFGRSIVGASADSNYSTTSIALVLWFTVITLYLLHVVDWSPLVTSFRELSGIEFRLDLTPIILIWVLVGAATRLPWELVEAICGILFVIMSPIVTVIIPLIALLNFVDQVYPRLPAELGGSKPQCAYLDLAHEEVSSQVWLDLVPDGETGLPDAVKVRRSALLEVSSLSKDSMIVRRSGAEGNMGTRYELRGRRPLIRSLGYRAHRLRVHIPARPAP